MIIRFGMILLDFPLTLSAKDEDGGGVASSEGDGDGSATGEVWYRRKRWCRADRMRDRAMQLV